MRYSKDTLIELNNIMAGACHAKGCETIFRCPRYCSCRKQRTFKLNTETAVCWEISQHIWKIIKSHKPSKRYIEDIIQQVIGVSEISRYHMTQGWETLFENAIKCIRYCTVNLEYWSISESKFIMISMKRSISQLSRQLK